MLYFETEMLLEAKWQNARRKWTTDSIMLQNAVWRLYHLYI